MCHDVSCVSCHDVMCGAGAGRQCGVQRDGQVRVHGGRGRGAGGGGARQGEVQDISRSCIVYL